MEGTNLNKDTHVLVVDDEPEIRNTMERILSTFVSVYTTGLPEEAMEILKKEPISLCLIDQNLSTYITGIELASKLKTQDKFLKIIMITGESDTKVVIDALNSGAIDTFLSKPFDIMELKEYMEKNLVIAADENRQIKKVIDKIRRGETILPKDISLIADDMSQLENLMFDFRIQPTPNNEDKKNELLGMVVFDDIEIVYKKIKSDDFMINDEFMFRGLVLTLSNLSDELFTLKEDAKILDEIKLPNVHIKVHKIPNFTLVLFLSGAQDMSSSVNGGIKQFFNELQRNIKDEFDNSTEQYLDQELQRFAISLSNM